MVVKKVMILTLTTLDSFKILSGSWSTNKTRRYLAATGSVKMQQKTDYIHLNPSKARLVKLPEEYKHSSARYYYTRELGVYPVIAYM